MVNTLDLHWVFSEETEGCGGTGCHYVVYYAGQNMGRTNGVLSGYNSFQIIFGSFYNVLNHE